jgi:small nuclear ribonucleoprotein (snRNP)-like protein
MPGRESEEFRGYLRGVAAMMNLITSDKVKKLDKTNVLEYAIKLVEAQKEKDNAPSY